MSCPSFAGRKTELLATAVTLVFAYYALRASLFLPAYREMFANTDAELPRFTALVFRYSGTVTVLVAAVAAITLWAIWSRHRLGGLVAAAGIIGLGIGTQLLCSAAMAPLFRMINMMGQ